MKFSSNSKIKHSQIAVFEAYRDRLPEIARYIDDVREINVRSRKDDGQVSEIHNLWVADREVPKMMRSFLKPEHLRWDDYAKWDAETMTCRWDIQTRAFPGAIKCSGMNRFVDTGDGATLVELSGNLTLDGAKVKGVPRLLIRKIVPAIEQFIISLISPNLQKVNHSLQSFLDEVK